VRRERAGDDRDDFLCIQWQELLLAAQRVVNDSDSVFRIPLAEAW
jgi:hypothetical protein